MKKNHFHISEKQIADFCHRWHITEIALFGSILRDDFNSESDIDILVTFSPVADWSLFDHVRMEQELEKIVGRKIDVLRKVYLFFKYFPEIEFHIKKTEGKFFIPVQFFW